MSENIYEKVSRLAGQKAPNYDAEAGIHYGVISQNTPNAESVDDIVRGPHSRDLGHESAVEEAKKKIRAVVEAVPDERREEFRSIADEWFFGSEVEQMTKQMLEEIDETSSVEENVESVWSAIEDRWNDRYEGGELDFLYEDDGYKIIKCLDNDMMILKSKYFTFAPQCSPCVPNAGNLDSATEDKHPTDYFHADVWEKHPDFRPGRMRTYCLHHEFFDKQRAPYPVWSVETGNAIVVREAKVECPNCKGTGRDSIKRLAEVRGVTEEALLQSIKDGNERLIQDVQQADGTFLCWRCEGAGKLSEIVYEEIESDGK